MSQVQRTILDSRDESAAIAQEAAPSGGVGDGGGEAHDGRGDAALLQQLMQLGFAEVDAEAAVRSTARGGAQGGTQGGAYGGGGGGGGGGGSGPRARAIDWLCLNLREERLPDRYRPFAKARAIRCTCTTLPPTTAALHPAPAPECLARRVHASRCAGARCPASLAHRGGRSRVGWR